jgi:hypothetical protein
LVFFVVIGIICGAYVWRKHPWRSRDNTPALQAQLSSTNPMHSGGYIREDFEVPRQYDRLASFFRMVYHPGRIMLGFFQVITQIGPVSALFCCALFCTWVPLCMLLQR